MSEVKGTQNLEKYIDFACGLTQQIVEVTADGKVTLLELPQFLDEALAIPGIAKAWGEVKAEIDDLDADEKAAMYLRLINKFDIPNDKVEEAIERAIGWVLATVELVKFMKGLKTPTTV